MNHTSGWARSLRAVHVANWSMGLAMTALLTSASNHVEAGVIPIDMGAANSFAVLGASTVTNTGPSVIFGDVGVASGTSITGFPPGLVFFGSLHFNTPEANQAQTAALGVYNTLLGLSPTMDLTGQDLGGMVLTPGVYNFDSSAFLTGTLTLDGQGQTNPFFAFQIGTTLITASDASVDLINGTFSSANDIFWQVGSSATLGTDTNFVGTIIADQSATLNTDASLDGRVIALNAAVTLDSNEVFNFRAIPAPGSLALLGLAALFRVRRRSS